MVEQQQEIINRLGLHARAAAKLVHLASGFESKVQLVKDDEEVDAKSILGILLLAAAQGSHVTIRCSGADEEQACKAIVSLIEERFGEDA